jgi:hypothetical protein
VLEKGFPREPGLERQMGVVLVSSTLIVKATVFDCPILLPKIFHVQRPRRSGA